MLIIMLYDDGVFKELMSFLFLELYVCRIDGLNGGPILLGSYQQNVENSSANSDTWLQVAKTAVEERIHKYDTSKEINFTLLRITKSPLSIINTKLAEIGEELSALERDGDTRIVRGSEGNSEDGDSDNSSKRNNTERIEWLSQLQNHYLNLKDSQLECRRNQIKENIRRKHNYIPFIVQLLREISALKTKRDFIK